MAFGKAVATAFFLLSLGSCFTFRVAHAALLPVPSLKWSLQLEGSGRLSGRGLRRGNGIIAHRDGTKIVATADDASLHIIQTTNQVKTLAVYVPEGFVGRSMECRSGAAFVEKEQHDGLLVASGEGNNQAGDGGGAQYLNDDYIIYAVVDNKFVPDVAIESGMIGSTARNGNTVDGEGEDESVKSRVIAVNMDGSFRWSVEVSGRIEGSPVVGENGIYVTHNDSGGGHLSVLRVQNSGRAFVVATVDPIATEPGSVVPLGPPALQKPGLSNEEEDGDIVIVAESWGSGFSESAGGLYMLSTTKRDSDEKKEDDGSAGTPDGYDYSFIKISSWSRSAIAQPLVHGDSIFLGAAGGAIGGFTGDRKSDLSGITSGREREIFPRWNYQVATNPRNTSQPLRSQPTLDLETELLVIPGVSADFYCIQSDNGRQVWRDNQGSQVMAQPRIFVAEGWRKVVYAIETLNGRVRQYDLLTGRRFWDYSCADISEQMCRDAVEAEFAITQSGNTIYYGDIYGRVNALTVANFATETPTTAPSPLSSANPTAISTAMATLAPTNAPVSATDRPSVGSKPTLVVADSPWEEIETNDDDQQEEEQQQQPWKDEESEDEPSGIIDQQSAKKGDSNRTAAYIGATMAALCVLLIPIVIFSLLRRKRKKPTKGQELVVEIIDDCSSGASESDDGIDHLSTNEVNDDFDPYKGDGIEVEMKSRTVLMQGSPSKTKRKRRKKSAVPDTPNTVNTLESIEELPEEASAMVVVGDDYDVEDPSVEAVNLRHTFEKAVDTRAPAPGEVMMGAGSNHLEIAVGDSNDSFLSDDDVPPPPPPPPLKDSEPSLSKQWTWGSLLQMGTAQSSKRVHTQKSPKESSEKLELKKTSRVVSMPKAVPLSESPSDRSTQLEAEATLPISESVARDDEPIAEAPQQTDSNPGKSKTVAMETHETTETLSSTEEEKKESEESEIRPGTPVLHDESPSSPQTSSVLPYVMNNLSPPESVLSNQESLFSSPNRSRSNSVGSDDESLYTSYTGMTGGTREKKDEKDLSPLSYYVFDQDIRRRDRSEIVNEEKNVLNHPDLSKQYGRDRDKFQYLESEEHPDDESVLAPGMQYMSRLPEETQGSKYGTSARSKRGTNSFTATNSSKNEYTHTPLAQMYDQLAAIGQQKREEKRPAFKRRSKRVEREIPSASPQPDEEQAGDTWGSFLDELAEAEKHFFSPSAAKTKSLLNDSDSEGNSEDAEVARINNLYNH
mmetsp:Transcript_19365/g.44899  ORF Transcript_19365/g.44899 Transcript_19365/m.44899 type:complete len:1238 (+) Transcript_19365:258-3971(+)